MGSGGNMGGSMMGMLLGTAQHGRLLMGNMGGGPGKQAGR
jgi:hypothetical protein